MNTREAGFTFVEILVVTVLGVVVLGAIYRTITVQERSYRQQGAMIATQQATRATLATLEAELREVSATGGDLISISPQSVTFRAYRKVGFVCGVSSPHLDVFEVGEPFSADDDLFVLADNDPARASDDEWRLMEVVNAGASSCADDLAGFPKRQLNVPTGNLSGVLPGAPVRSFVQMTYGIYSIDGEWVLGRIGPGDTDPVPLIGPLAPPDENGLVFRYFAVNGAATTNPASVVRIEIHVRGQAVGGSHVSREYVDSLTTQLFLRNR